MKLNKSYIGSNPTKRIYLGTNVVYGVIGYGMNTTGGEGGTTTTVTTASAFNTARVGDSPKTIIVDGNLTVGYALIGSNTTIIGKPGASLSGTLRIQGTNVIVKNLILTAPVIGGTDQDAIAIAGGTNVWIDHCTIYDWTDGAIDITTGADFVTVSWCRFYQTADYYHAFANLVGSSDTAGATDSGKLRVTFHNNWWDINCKDRMPRVRFGRAHVFNNYYASYTPTIPKVSSYITAAIDSEILVQNNYFENGEDPLYYYPTQNGKIQSVGNYFDPLVTGAKTGNDTVFTPPYTYTLKSPSVAKAEILLQAGATLIT